MVRRYAHLAAERALRERLCATRSVVAETTAQIRHRVKNSRARIAASPLKFGRPCRDRTYDQRIKSPLLYQLS